MRALSSTTLAASLALLGGCSAAVGTPSELDADTATPVHAVVVVERAQQGDGARVAVVARFVSVRGGVVDDRALRMVGALSRVPAGGACAVLDDAEEGAVRGVELHDVGAVTLEAASTRSALVTRQVPDPIGRVTGVFYFSPADIHAVAPGAKVSLLVQGSPHGDIAPFVVAGAAPRDLGEVRVAGQDIARPVVVAASGGPIEITWEGSEGASPRPGDDATVFVDVSTARQTTRCAFADVGRASVPAAALSGDTGQITLHRIKRDRFAARGVEPGELRFDFSRTASFTRAFAR